MMAAGGRRRGRGREAGREDRVHRRPRRLRRRQEDQRHQGGPRDHRPGPQGGQGPGRRRPEARQGERRQGRRREVKKKLEDAGAKVSHQVSRAGRYAARRRPDLPESQQNARRVDSIGLARIPVVANADGSTCRHPRTLRRGRRTAVRRVAAARRRQRWIRACRTSTACQPSTVRDSRPPARDRADRIRGRDLRRCTGRHAREPAGSARPRRRTRSRPRHPD